MRLLLLILILNLFIVEIAETRTLTPLEQFYRCYAHITQGVPSFDDPLIARVSSGQVTPSAACLQVLDKALFVAQNGTQIQSANDGEAKAVLRNFHALHFSFFGVKDFTAVTNMLPAGNQDFFDTSTPAMYLTRALFRPNTHYSTITTLNEHVRAIRSDNSPARGAASNRTIAQTIFPNGIFAPQGDLIGIETIDTLRFDFRFGDSSGTVDLANSLGGGLIGSNPFVLMNVQEPFAFKSNVANMPRKWSKAVFNDLLCRDLPVIRLADAVPHVTPNSNIDFKKSSSCVRCHASMDRMAASHRRFRYTRPGNAANTGNLQTIFTMGIYPTNQPQGPVWPENIDPDFANRPAAGVLYYRDYLGNLKNVDVAGVSSLGGAIAQTDDLYICASKRYYKYFLGIDVDTGDIFDPAEPVNLTATDLKHRQNVINLGLQLKSHGSLRTLVQEILNLNEYKESGYGQ